MRAVCCGYFFLKKKASFPHAIFEILIFERSLTKENFIVSPSQEI